MTPRSRLLLYALLVAACGPQPEVCFEDQDPSPVSAQRQGEAGLLPYAHAHNDYEHPRPLEDALSARFYSVEADVYFARGRFEVSHNGWGSKGTLEALYLSPLQERVEARGSIHGDGIPFTLWIDFKDSDPRLVAELETLLARFDMLQNPRGEEAAAPVRIALTGKAAMKEAFSNGTSLAAVTRDSNAFSLEDPVAVDERWRAYALDWGKYLSWNGVGDMPADQRRRLNCLVENAHAKGRVLRLYATPDREEVWRASLEAGVDFIHTDHLEALSTFLRDQG